ncbi:MAG: hypothetical protein Q4D50_04295 [Eubacteriales bacterium]|nr:hypothetical protein [Eubacteriales bacterium]
MKTTMKKLLSFVLVAVLLVSAIPFQASATEKAYSAQVEIKVDGETIETKTVGFNKAPSSISTLLQYDALDLSAYSGYKFSHSWKDGMGSARGDMSIEVNDGETIKLAYVSISDGSDQNQDNENQEETTTTPVQPITLKLLFNDDTAVSKTLTHTPSNGVSSTIADLLYYVYDANWDDTYDFYRANNSRLGTTYDINAEVLAGESINVRLKAKAQEVKPIDIIVKVDSSDNVVWTGSKVPSNGTSSKVEDLLSYCWNKDWDDVYEFDHAWSHEQQKNVARTGSVNAGDTLYIMVNKLDSSKPTTGTAYSVTFKNVSGDAITTVKTDTNGYLSSSDITYAAARVGTKSGYTFKGWQVSTTRSANYFTNTELAAEKITANTTLVPYFEVNSTSDKLNSNKVYLHIFLNNKVDEPAKNIDITNGIALDGKVTLAEVKTVVKNYYTSKTSDGIGYDGLYFATGDWVGKFVKDDKVDTIDNIAELKRDGYVHINIMITNATAKSTSSSNADTSNPKTGDTFTATMTVMTISASALVLVYLFNKKRALAK